MPDPVFIEWLPLTERTALGSQANRRPAQTEKLIMLGGLANLDPAALPRLGPLENKYVIVELFDYTCTHCRRLHEQLVEARQQLNGQLTIVLVPVPLSQKCNDLMSEENSTSPDACDIAKLSLMIWRLSPDRYEEFHDWMYAYEGDKPRFFREARRRVVMITTEDALSAIERDSAFDRQIARHVDMYAESADSGADLMPQIMTRYKILSGEFESAAELLAAMKEEFGVGAEK
jgi:hypothetical protein